MNLFEMAVLIVAIVMGASIIRAKARQGTVAEARPEDGDAERLREEVRLLKERVAVLERLATDNHGALALDREIEKLR